MIRKCSTNDPELRDGLCVVWFIAMTQSNSTALCNLCFIPSKPYLPALNRIESFSGKQNFLPKLFLLILYLIILLDLGPAAVLAGLQGG